MSASCADGATKGRRAMPGECRLFWDLSGRPESRTPDAAHKLSFRGPQVGEGYRYFMEDVLILCKRVDPAMAEPEKLQHIAHVDARIACSCRGEDFQESTGARKYVCVRSHQPWLLLTSFQARCRLKLFEPSSATPFAKISFILGSPRHLRCSLSTIPRSLLLSSLR